MVELWGGIASKVTDAAGRAGRKAGQLLRSGSDSVTYVLTESPVLTEEAVKTAAPIEDSQILKPVLRTWPMGKPRIAFPSATGTDPVGHTIRGQGIMVPGYPTPPW